MLIFENKFQFLPFVLLSFVPFYILCFFNWKTVSAKILEA